MEDESTSTLFPHGLSRVLTGLFRKFSAFLPLHQGLVVTTDREKVAVIFVEDRAHDVLRVSTIRAWLGTLTGRISEECDETVIVSTCEKFAVMRSSDTINVGTVSSARVDTFSVP